MVKDLRTGFETGNPAAVLDGALDGFMAAALAARVGRHPQPGQRPGAVRWRGGTATGGIWTGIGGWTFAPWRGPFYPPGLPHAQELAYAAERLTAIEINGTFYRTQSPASFAKWAASVPQGVQVRRKGAPCDHPTAPLWQNPNPPCSASWPRA